MVINLNLSNLFCFFIDYVYVYMTMSILTHNILFINYKTPEIYWPHKTLRLLWFCAISNNQTKV
jgi:hypothetical protein